MSDKILTESLAAIRAIEESDDPFCIGAEADGVVESYTEVEEVEEAVEAAVKAVEESVDDWATPKEYEFTDDSGHHYSLSYQDGKYREVGILEVNGITAAHYSAGGAGPSDVKILKPDLVMLALEAAFIGKH